MKYRDLRRAVLSGVYLRLILGLILGLAAAGLMAASGCLSPDQRQAVLDDLTITREVIVTAFPPGDDRDQWLKRLDLARSVEEIVKLREQARAAAATRPSTN